MYMHEILEYLNNLLVIVGIGSAVLVLMLILFTYND
jgi:hypothetical protein